MRIDLGGIAKGYSVDRGIEILQKQGITRAMVNAGGDTRIIGDRFGKPWVVGIRDPDHEGKTFLRMPLTDTAFSTSGDYERYFDEDGKRFHHIIDPKTGDSARKCRSVTIISGHGHAHRCADQERVHHGSRGGHRVHQHAAGSSTPLCRRAGRQGWSYSKGLAGRRRSEVARSGAISPSRAAALWWHRRRAGGRTLSALAGLMVSLVPVQTSLFCGGENTNVSTVAATRSVRASDPCRSTDRSSRCRIASHPQ